jgi:hypothetical protein
VKFAEIASNIWVILARMSFSENTAENRSFGLSCAAAGGTPSANIAASPTMPASNERRSIEWRMKSSREKGCRNLQRALWHVLSAMFALGGSIINM